MNLSRELLNREAAETGFRAEVLEKVFLLFELLEGFRDHPALSGQLALKGGTALNLFVFKVPRLSIDIDLNYVGETDVASMQRSRPEIERAVTAVCERLGFTVRRIPSEHAGGKWRLQYSSALGQGGSLEVDLNFLLRVPLWPLVTADSAAIGTKQAMRITTLDVNELAAGKLAALFARRASRDLYDVWLLLKKGNLDSKKLRLGFVVYAASNRMDFRSLSPVDVSVDVKELKDKLLPVLANTAVPERGRIDEWCAQLISDCRTELSVVLPFNSAELEFLDAINDRGEIKADIITDDSNLRERIRLNPALQWKAQNVVSFSREKNARSAEKGKVTNRKT